MTVVVRTPSNTIKVLSKGADSVLLPLLKEADSDLKDMTLKHLQTFAQDGLRTLLLVEKTISEKEYQSWASNYEAAKASIDLKEERIAAAVA